MDRGSGFQSHQPSTSENPARPKNAEQKRLEERWYFSSDQLRKTPSISTDSSEQLNKEVWGRYQCAELVQSIGQRMKLPQFAINTAILYMHRFYQFHSMTRFHRHTMAPVFVFLAAKVDENPRRLDMVVRETHRILYPNEPALVDTTEKYLEELQNMVTHENVLLQTLAFDLSVQHPHEKVIRCCQLIRCDKELSHAAYDLASCALHFTSLCIQYTPVLVASMCVHVAAKWSNVRIPLSEPDKKPWWFFMDPSLTEAQIQKVTDDFLTAVEGYPLRVRTKIWNQVLGLGRTPAGYVGPQAGKPGPTTPAPPGTVPLVNTNKPDTSSAVTQGLAAGTIVPIKSGEQTSQSKLIGSSSGGAPRGPSAPPLPPVPPPQGLPRPPAPKPPPPGPPAGHRPPVPPPPPVAVYPGAQTDSSRERQEQSLEGQRRSLPGYAAVRKEDIVKKEESGLKKEVKEESGIKKEITRPDIKKEDVKPYRDQRTVNPVPPRHGSTSMSNGNAQLGTTVAEKRPAHLFTDDNGNVGSPSAKRRRTDADAPVIPPENVMRT